MNVKSGFLLKPILKEEAGKKIDESTLIHK